MEIRKFVSRGITEEELQITKRTLEKIKQNVIDRVKLQI